MSLTAYADDPYASLQNTTTVVHFDSKDWYLIEYDSSTVTLLSKDCVATSQYNSSGSYVAYSKSTVKTAVDTYYNTLSENAKTAVSGDKMFLLTTEEANAITNDKVRICPSTGYDAWWLDSPSSLPAEKRGDVCAACVEGDTGVIDDGGHVVDDEIGVRPALKLNLESVIFSSDTFEAVAVTGVPPPKDTDGNEKKYYTLSGTIKKSDGTNPADGASVVLIKGNDSIDRTTADNSGKYSFSAPEGTYNMVVSYTGAGKDKIQKTILVTLDKDRTLDVTLPDAAGQQLEFFDLKLERTSSNTGTPDIGGKNNKLLTIIIPFEMGNKTNIVIYRSHNSAAEVITTTANASGEAIAVTADSIILKAKKFSTYAVGYTVSGSSGASGGAISSFLDALGQGSIGSALKAADASPKDDALNPGLQASPAGSDLLVRWSKVSGADGYKVYAAYCGTSFPDKAEKMVTSPSVTSVRLTTIGGKKIDYTKEYKLYVVAYKKSAGKQKVLSKSIVAHVVGKNSREHTNVKSISVQKPQVTLSKGKTHTIKAFVTPVRSGKEMLGESHAAKFRYWTSNKKVADVSREGKITTKDKGTCYIYVYAVNGKAEKIKVTVK